MMQKNQAMQDFLTLLTEKIGKKTAEKVMENAWTRFQNRLEAHADEPKALKKHTVGTLYPAISVYEALQEAKVPNALSLMDEMCSQRAEGQAQMIRSLLKIPGLYKAMPAMFRWMTVQNFGEAAGFRAHFYDTGKDQCKFDMTHCAFYEVCKENGCPELTPCFCHTDDVTNGNMHPKLRWHRTQTIGEGGTLCDFEITVKK